MTLTIYFNIYIYQNEAEQKKFIISEQASWVIRWTVQHNLQPLHQGKSDYTRQTDVCQYYDAVSVSKLLILAMMGHHWIILAIAEFDFSDG